MKTTNLLFIFLSLFFISCNKKLNDIPKISKGMINENWQYSNSTMKFKLQLPQDWNLVDNSDGMSKFIPMSDKAPRNILGTEAITISKIFDFKDESAIYPIFSISSNTLEDIRSGNRKEDLGFAVVSSQNGNAEDDVEDAKKAIISQMKGNPEALKLNEQNLKSKGHLSFGKKDKIPYFQFTIPDVNGNATGNRIYAFKNYGNYNLIILITYFDEQELVVIKKIMENDVIDF